MINAAPAAAKPGAEFDRVAAFVVSCRFWRWRMTGGHLPLARMVTEHVDSHRAPDVVLATSMTNLPALLAHTRVALSDVPVVLYMHENQLTYIDRGKPAWFFQIPPSKAICAQSRHRFITRAPAFTAGHPYR